MKPLASTPASIRDEAIALRRTLHAKPELAFEEVATAQVVADRMRARGLPVKTGLGKTGVAATLDTGKSGPTVLLRADLDGLPLEEKTGLPFASTNGKMHACGHDGHVAALDAAADLLLLSPPPKGRVVFAFQPAEEGAGGAAAMIADGVLSPLPDAVFGIHLWTSLPLGTIGVATGPMMANVDEFRIEVEGPGGHAASPHESRDTVVAAAQVVTALQTIVSRRISPLRPAVVSVTSIHGGSAFNVLPGAVTLVGTARSFDRDVAQALPGLVESTAIAAAGSVGCTARVTYRRSNRALVNAEGPSARCRAVARSIPGVDGIVSDCRTMGGEDFSEFLERAPGAFAFVGAASAKRGAGPAHHAADFDFDERAIEIAAALHVGMARAFLSGD